jgi:hypothetical protein
MAKFRPIGYPREPLMTPRDYLYHIKNCCERFHEGPEDGDSYDVFVLTLLLLIEKQGRKQWSKPIRDYLRFPPSGGAWRIVRFLDSLIPKEKYNTDQEFDLKAESFIGRRGWLTITHKEWQGQTQNSIAYICRRPPEAAATPSPAKASAAVSPDEEETPMPTQEEIDDAIAASREEVPELPTEDELDMGEHK